MNREITGTHQKALQINLDPTKYGTFAEIGAGLEVARWFFRVGGAAGEGGQAVSASYRPLRGAPHWSAERSARRHAHHARLARGYGSLVLQLRVPRRRTPSGIA